VNGLIDSHAHLSFPELAGQLPDVWKRAASAGVGTIVTVGTGAADTRRAVEIARQATSPAVHVAGGCHPHDAAKTTEDDLRRIAALAAEGCLVAWGEMGLDYHYDFSPRDAQRRAFADQLDRAAGAGLPGIIHSREAIDDTLAILDESGGEWAGRLVFHCFTGTADEARRVLDRGYLIGLTGVVTFRNAAALRETARLVPDDRLLIETDSPYMSPEPVRKQRPNEPALLVHTVRCLAGLRGASYESLAAATSANARRLFGLDKAPSGP